VIKSRSLAGMRTRLDAFKLAEQNDLIDWGYVLADTALRRWCAGLCSNPQRPVTLPGSGTPAP